MKSKLSSIIFYAVIILALGWGVMWFVRKTIPPKMEFQTTELRLTGNNVKTTINDLRGNVVIVSFFQTWCGPCIQEMYEFDEMLATINSPNFKILCISDEDKDRIDLLQNRFTPGKIMFAHSSKSLSGMGIHVYPTTYLLNKKGEVIQSKLEGYNWSQEKEIIKKLMAE
jgi:thiol-disulfide isomerase/thioredoxin